MSTVTMKACLKCGRVFPATPEFFYRSTAMHDGLHTWCKECEIKCDKARLPGERGRRRINARLRFRRLTALNPEWRKDRRQYSHTYSAYYRQHRIDPEKERARHRESWHRQYEDPRFRLSETISSYIRHCFHSPNTKGGRSWENLVGYTLNDLVQHLESLFRPGMTWENHGFRGWHIDHIRPISSFAFASPEDPGFKECWSLKNLRPLWATENLMKGSRLEVGTDV